MAYRILPVSDLPNIDFPTIQVSGGSARAQAPRRWRRRSRCRSRNSSRRSPASRRSTPSSNPDSTSITIQFDLSRNIDAAAQDVQAMIAKAARQLPPQMPAPPSLQKVNPADQPILFLGLNSPSLPLSVVDEYAQTITQRISMVNGVASVTVDGSQKYAVRIDVDPRQLAARGIGLDEVATACRRGQRRTCRPARSTGRIRPTCCRRTARCSRAAATPQTIVAYRQGQPRCGSTRWPTSTTASSTTS